MLEQDEILRLQSCISASDYRFFTKEAAVLHLQHWKLDALRFSLLYNKFYDILENEDKELLKKVSKQMEEYSLQIFALCQELIEQQKKQFLTNQGTNDAAI